jgi:hypothetical protein
MVSRWQNNSVAPGSFEQSGVAPRPIEGTFFDFQKSGPMLTGKQFKLERATLAVANNAEGKRRAVTIPVGAVIKVLAGPKNGDGLVNVLWEGQALEMFAVDVDVRGTEIVEPKHAQA